jgi:hypothetical protein
LESKDADPAEASLPRLGNKAKNLYGILHGLKLLEYCTFFTDECQKTIFANQTFVPAALK